MIATHREWPAFAGLELLSQRGLLFYGRVWDDGKEHPAWIVTDSSRRNAQARRLDGQPWAGIGGAKAKTLADSDASWPIGANEIGDRQLVVLCEGLPDFCSALLVAWFEGCPVSRVAPVCMTGAGNSIHPEALPLFAGKHVRIAIHDDEAGRRAAKNWANQIFQAGAEDGSVDGFNFGGLKRPDDQCVKDLADFATSLDDENPPPVCVFQGCFKAEVTNSKNNPGPHAA